MQELIATAGMDQKLFVSRYLVALPSVEKLRRYRIHELAGEVAMQSEVQCKNTLAMFSFLVTITADDQKLRRFNHGKGFPRR